MMMSQHFTPGFIGGYPTIDAIRTDLNRLYYSDIRTGDNLTGSLPILNYNIQPWAAAQLGLSPWQTVPPWAGQPAPIAGTPWSVAGTYQLPVHGALGWPVGNGLQVPMSVPFGAQYVHPGVHPAFGQTAVAISPFGMPAAHGYLPVNGQTVYGQTMYGQPAIGTSAFVPVHPSLTTDPRFAADPRFVTDPRLASDPRFAPLALDPRLGAQPQLPIQAQLPIQPQLVNDPRLGVDPRLVADPRLVDPRIAMIDPRLSSWMAGSAQLYSSLSPAVNCAETPDAHLLVVELPGVDVRDISLQVAGTQLILTAFRKPIWNNGTVTVGYHSTEGRFGTLRRVFQLPAGYPASQIQANFVTGQITIVLPKAAAPMGAASPAANVAINASIPATV